MSWRPPEILAAHYLWEVMKQPSNGPIGRILDKPGEEVKHYLTTLPITITLWPQTPRSQASIEAVYKSSELITPTTQFETYIYVRSVLVVRQLELQNEGCGELLLNLIQKISTLEEELGQAQVEPPCTCHAKVLFDDGCQCQYAAWKRGRVA